MQAPDGSEVPFGPPTANKVFQTRYQLVRTPANKRMRWRVLSDYVSTAELHYVERRSMPHRKTDCPYCGSHPEKRLKGYLAVEVKGTGELVILELTENCLEPLRKFYGQFSTLRGNILETWRKGSASNSPVYATMSQPVGSMSPIPECFDLAVQMHRIWFGGKNQFKVLGDTPTVAPGGQQAENPSFLVSPGTNGAPKMRRGR